MTDHSATRAVRQFSTRYLFLLTAIAALSLLPIANWGVAGSLPSIWLVAVGLSLLHKRYVIAASLMGFAALCALLLPSLGNARPAARRNNCISNVRQITAAILRYEEANGYLPPPYTVDDEGQPLHSWRVLILPYLEEQELYDAIDLTKPWHHPDNIGLASRMPLVYRCPSFETKSRALDVTTAYVAILGDNTAWPRSGKRQIEDVIDGPSMTIAVLESEMHRLHWMSTADPAIEMIGPINGNGDTLLAYGPHSGCSVCAYCDAHTVCFHQNLDFNVLRALLTIDGDDAPEISSYVGGDLP